MHENPLDNFEELPSFPEKTARFFQKLPFGLTSLLTIILCSFSYAIVEYKDSKPIEAETAFAAWFGFITIAFFVGLLFFWAIDFILQRLTKKHYLSISDYSMIIAFLIFALLFVLAFVIDIK